MGSSFFNLTFLDAQPTIVPSFHNGVPIDQVKLYFFIVGAPDEITLDLVNSIVDFGGNSNELHDVVGNATKGGLGKDGPTSHVQKFGFPATQLIVHAIRNELVITVGRLLVEDGEAQVFSKVVTRLYVQGTGAGVGLVNTAVRGEDDFRLSGVNTLARLLTEVLECADDFRGIGLVSFFKKGEIISKEEVGEFWTPLGDFNRGPKFVSNFPINVSRESLYAEDKKIGGDGISQPYASGRLKRLSFLSIYQDANGAPTNTGHDKLNQSSREIEEDEGIPEEGPSIFIKGFFQINFENHVDRFPFHFFEMRDVFWKMMALSEAFQLDRKLVCRGQ